MRSRLPAYTPCSVSKLYFVFFPGGCAACSVDIPSHSFREETGVAVAELDRFLADRVEFAECLVDALVAFHPSSKLIPCQYNEMHPGGTAGTWRTSPSPTNRVHFPREGRDSVKRQSNEFPSALSEMEGHALDCQLSAHARAHHWSAPTTSCNLHLYAYRFVALMTRR